MSVATLPSFCTYGRPLTLRDLGGIALSIGDHAPSEVIPTHRHTDEYQWCIALEGAFEEFAGSRHESCGTGSLLVRPSDCVHANRFARMRGVCLNLFPRGAWLTKHDLMTLTDTYSHQRTQRLATLGQELALELQRPDATTQSLELLVLELLESAARLDRFDRDGRSKWFALALDQIEAEPAADLQLGALAREAGVSAGHLARTFRAAFGKSAGDYVRERRVRRAAKLMRNPKAKLADIAASVGFCDQSHFSRAFKAEYGLAPAAYRKQLQETES